MEGVVHIDHVILGTADLEAAGRRLLEEFGLASVPGGTHPEWGTANRIVPLGWSYVEILGVVHPEVASRTFLGTHLEQQVAEGDRLIGWCLATDDIERTAARLGLEVTAGSRTLPDGQVLRWRTAGLAEAMQSRYLPFFISWEIPPDLHPGRVQADHAVTTTGTPVVEVGGDFTRVEEWLGNPQPPTPRVKTIGGPPRIRVSIATTSGEVVLE